MTRDRTNVSRAVKEEKIDGKPVYVFEDHATALVAWSRIARGLPQTPYLISLDQHLDTRPAFNSFLRSTPRGRDNFAAESKRLVSLIKLDSESEAKASLRHLDNDEHIEAAIRAGFLSFAFALSPQAAGKSFCPESSRIFEMKLGDGEGSIEASVLASEVQWIHSVLETFGLERAEMILDIDLDFFESLRAVEPKDPSSFFALVRQAVAVTVALEPAYVAVGVDHDKLSAGLFELLRRALRHKGPQVG
jgi:hypothetical protein